MGPETRPQERYHDELNSPDSDTWGGEDARLLRPDADEQDEEQEPSFWSKYTPAPVKRVGSAVAKWTKGPDPPRPFKVEPFFPKIQTAPLRLINDHFPKRAQKAYLLIAFYLCWFLCFAVVLHTSAFASDIPGYGSPVHLSCGNRFWYNGNDCGINGDLCRPFDNSSFAFRCPANCKRVIVAEPHAVGDQEISYVPLVIGGQSGIPNGHDGVQYRGDSFICGAAIHAGYISNTQGGCGVVSLVGEHSNFPSEKRNGISSIGFDSWFPKTFTFLKDTQSQCRDLRWPLLGVSLFFTIILSLFTDSPAVFFPSVFTGIFFHVALVSDPPNLATYNGLVSLALGRFLPAAFCAAVVYKYCVRRTLNGLQAQIEKTILWLGGCWVGALNNYTFDKIPIQRLTPHDIQQQPGAIPALIIVILVLISIVLYQAWCFRIEGRFNSMLRVYAIMVGFVLVLVAIPKMNVRIHHYILGLIFSPGTSMQNRPSLLFQGLLIGLFINGIARWGFDSILQTPLELRGDAQLGTLLPSLLPPIVYNNFDIPKLAANITFHWATPLPEDYDGVSVLVNEVEMFRGYNDVPGKDIFTWVRHRDDVPEYFRFAYLSGNAVGDYTKAGVWDVGGGWTNPEAGPSLESDNSDS